MYPISFGMDSAYYKEGGQTKEAARNRKNSVKVWTRYGVSAQQIASSLKISTRSVHRIRAKIRKEDELARKSCEEK